MKFKFEIECELETEGKKENNALSNIKKKTKEGAIKLANKALDGASIAVSALENAIDKAGDALLDAEFGPDEEIAKNDSDESGDSDDDEDDLPEDKPKRKYTLWKYLDKTCNYNVDSSRKVVDCEKEVDKFFKAIGYEANECSIKAFETSVTLKKITYDTVIANIEGYFPALTGEDIKELLKDDFKDWLEYMKPDVKESCPSANFIYLLKYFVKKVRAS